MMRRTTVAIALAIVLLALPAGAQQQGPTIGQVAWQRVAQRQLFELEASEERAIQQEIRAGTAEQERDQYHAQLVAILEADEDGLAAQIDAARELLGYETQEE